MAREGSGAVVGREEEAAGVGGVGGGMQKSEVRKGLRGSGKA
jgi:hypothetical protein